MEVRGDVAGLPVKAGWQPWRNDGVGIPRVPATVVPKNHGVRKISVFAQDPGLQISVLTSRDFRSDPYMEDQEIDQFLSTFAIAQASFGFGAMGHARRGHTHLG